ncbi:MAG TPA: DinB family protein [Acidimicrobiales bacterium]|nr:DinB family protein [Acidimicrobiales bacterium]
MSRWPCEECRFDPVSLDDEALIEAVAAIPKRYTAPLTRFLPADDPAVVLRTRPAAGVWSALEYVVHTRVAVEFYDERIRRVVEEDRPQLTAPASWDELCDEGRYNDYDPADALEQLAAAASSAAGRLRALTPEQWHRTGIGIEGDTRTVRLLAERLVHDAHHHLLDVGRSMRAARDAAKS